ncbi:MAG: adenine phosphoribosyltransferase [Thaumarchaeota archaeon]|nr:adenine phosphoribosyltransferase [Nitrososphaerota archaeon]
MTDADLEGRLKSAIRRIPDFPTKGIVFRDITTLWKDNALMRSAVEALYEHFKDSKPHVILGIEARGFVFGALLAQRFGVGFVPARKLGKLPFDKVTERYQLEYRTDGLELHRDAIDKGDRVLIVDDLMATAGTALAAAKMVETLGGVIVGLAVIVELSFLHGREKLKSFDVFSLVAYNSEAE